MVDTSVSGVSLLGSVLLLSVVALVLRWSRSKKYHLPPGPRPLPIVGNWLDFQGKTLTEQAEAWKQSHGPVYTVYLSTQRYVFINSLEALIEAYVKRGTDFASKPQMTSLAASSGNYSNIAFAPFNPRFKHRRKAVMHCIRQYLTGDQNTERVHHVATAVVQNLLAESRSSQDKQVELNKHLTFGILNVIHMVLFGHMLKMDSPEFTKFNEMFDGVSGSIGGFWEDVIPFLEYWPTKKFSQHVGHVNAFIEYIEEQVKKRKERLDETCPNSIVDHLLLAQKDALQSKDEDVRESLAGKSLAYTILDVFFAGTDTTRSTLSWVFLLLSDRLEDQDRIQEEIDLAVGDGIPRREHRQDLVYTECTLLEAMRVYPVAPMGLPHETLRDTKLQGYDIPAKTGVMVNLWAVLRDPKQWDDPDTYKPERFLDDGKKIRTRNAGLVNFNVGSRSCVGEFLAMQTSLFMVVCMLQKLKFRLPEGVKANYEPQKLWQTLTPKPYYVLVEARQ